MTKSGFVALIGRPNSGKSTLLNRLIGQKVSIVSDKPQTTRSRALGIRTTADSQMAFVDTPGIHRPGYRLNERMMEIVYEVLRDVDLVVHLVDSSESYGKGEEYATDLVKQAEKPAILVLNKVDLVNKGKLLPIIDFYNQQYRYAEIIPLSAERGDNVGVLIEKIAEHLPEGPFLYPAEYVTDQQERFIASEIIREKVLSHTREELPYSTAVQIEEFDETEREGGFVRIAASIIVEKDGQKKIVIGRGGKMIKMIGTEARKEIQGFLDVRKVYLDLKVKVVTGWRNIEYLLNEFAFTN
ncbi:MAG: GTPase Era [Acidobacteriota bacterium]